MVSNAGIAFVNSRYYLGRMMLAPLIEHEGRTDLHGVVSFASESFEAVLRWFVSTYKHSSIFGPLQLECLTYPQSLQIYTAVTSGQGLFGGVLNVTPLLFDDGEVAQFEALVGQFLFGVSTLRRREMHLIGLWWELSSTFFSMLTQNLYIDDEADPFRALPSISVECVEALQDTTALRDVDGVGPHIDFDDDDADYRRAFLVPTPNYYTGLESTSSCTRRSDGAGYKIRLQRKFIRDEKVIRAEQEARRLCQKEQVEKEQKGIQKAIHESVKDASEAARADGLRRNPVREKRSAPLLGPRVRSPSPPPRAKRTFEVESVLGRSQGGKRLLLWKDYHHSESTWHRGTNGTEKLRTLFDSLMDTYVGLEWEYTSARRPVEGLPIRHLEEKDENNNDLDGAPASKRKRMEQ